MVVVMEAVGCGGLHAAAAVGCAVDTWWKA